MYSFITNPNARSGLGWQVWEQLETILKENAVPYEVHFTKYQRHATKIVRSITSDGQPHTIVILGGDGTVNEVMNGIYDLSLVTIGYIPIGSSNDFARYYQIPTDPVQALNMILNPTKTVDMNVGLLTHDLGRQTRRFAVSNGFGFDAGICHQALVSKIKPFLNKLHLGRLTYVGIALTQLAALKMNTITLTLDDGEPQVFEHAYFATAMNHPYEGGGFKFCPNADPADDVMDVTVIAGLPKLKVLFLLPTAQTGKHIKYKGVYTFTCRKTLIQSEHKLPIHTDGEPIFYQTEISACLESKKVHLIIG